VICACAALVIAVIDFVMSAAKVTRPVVVSTLQSALRIAVAPMPASTVPATGL
jgi:hypothetical protein